MKTSIIAIILFSSLFAFANNSNPKTESIRVANVILDNSQAITELSKLNVNIVDYSITEQQQGVNVFTFNLNRTCYCMPKPGTLVIVQDMRPTYRDGAIEYTYKLTWDN